MPHPGCLLALDTSTERLVIALVRGERTWRHESTGGAQASAQLLPRVQALMAEAGVPLAALDAIAFGRGPGAFTGLRTACSVAQGLAFGLGKPVLPIDSLAIVAEDARAAHGAAAESLWVAMDARMDEAYAGAYRWAAGAWQAEVPPGLWPVTTLARAWREAAPRCVAGSALAAFAERLPSGGALRLPEMADRAGALARLAVRAWASGEAVDAALALPVYLRDKVAQTSAEREAARPQAERRRPATTPFEEFND